MRDVGSRLQHSRDVEAFSVSLRSIRKSGRVLYAFSQFYTPFHALDLQWFFSHYDIFACISAAIYEIDEMIESGHSADEAFNGLGRLAAYMGTRVRPDQQISEILNDGRDYFLFEHGVLNGATFDVPQVVSLTAKRSFDFRLMHRALFQLVGREYDEFAFSWFRQFEILMEIEDDLQSFEVDAARGTFNILALIKRICDRKAIDLVDEYRLDVEAGLSDCVKDLSPTQQCCARQVLMDYRRIVPRPETPQW